MPIRPVSVGRFGSSDLAVRTPSPLPSYLIFTLTPAPADPNRHLLLPWELQSHPRVTLGSGDHPQYVRYHKSMGVHWGSRDLGDIVGIGATATLKPAQVSSKVTEVWVRLDGWEI